MRKLHSNSVNSTIQYNTIQLELTHSTKIQIAIGKCGIFQEKNIEICYGKYTLYIKKVTLHYSNKK